MSDVHECEDCGLICDCDGEDMQNPQPDDCVHLTTPGECSADDDEFGDDDSEPLLGSEDEIQIADSIRRGSTICAEE
jgi:hypothetical protein